VLVFHLTGRGLGVTGVVIARRNIAHALHVLSTQRTERDMGNPPPKPERDHDAEHAALPGRPCWHERAAVGVLFVPGIGVQPRGNTLAEFGGPLVKWLEDWYAGLHDQWVANGVGFKGIEGWLDGLKRHDPRQLDALRSLLDRAPPRGADAGKADPAAVKENVGETLAVAVRLSQATGGQPSGDAPPHARLEWTHLRLDGTTTQTAWLLAEAWWSETFAPPSFRDLARLVLGVLPYTIGSHLGVRVHRAWGRWRQDWSLGRLAVLLGRFGALLLGQFASLAALPLLALLLLVGLLPIPRVREGLGRLQQRMAAVLGDSYVLVVRPMQTAAIVGRVRHDLAWLADRCNQVAVVAHSQGGAVLNEVLRQEFAEGAAGLLPPQAPSPARAVAPVIADGVGHDSTGTAGCAGRLRLVLTFGSGLRKLHEVRWLLGPGRSFRWSSFLTLFYLVFFVVGALAVGGVVTGRDEAGTMGGAMVWFVIGSALLAGGLFDLVAKPPHGELEWWIDHLGRTGIRWRDYAASADPVPNGALIDEHQEFPEHMTVHNRGSLLRDHTTYWANQDEFIADVVGCLAGLDPSVAADFQDCQERFAFARRRRRWRVGWLIGCRWIAILAVAAALIRGRAQWLSRVAPALDQVPRLVGIEAHPPSIDMADLADVLRPVALVLAAYVVAVWAWRRLDRVETARLLARQLPDITAWIFEFSVVGLVCVGGWAAAPALWSASVHVIDAPAGVFLLGGVFWVVSSLWDRSQRRLGVYPPAPPKTKTSLMEEFAQELNEPPASTMAGFVGQCALGLVVLFIIGSIAAAAIGWLWGLVVVAALVTLTSAIAVVGVRRGRARVADQHGRRGASSD